MWASRLTCDPGIMSDSDDLMTAGPASPARVCHGGRETGAGRASASPFIHPQAPTCYASMGRDSCPNVPALALVHSRHPSWLGTPVGSRDPPRLASRAQPMRCWCLSRCNSLPVLVLLVVSPPAHVSLHSGGCQDLEENLASHVSYPPDQSGAACLVSHC